MEKKKPVNQTPRLLKMLWKEYKILLIIVLASILISSGIMIYAILFLQTLVDDYITPLIGVANPDFGPLSAAVVRVGSICAVGVVCSYLYNRLMVNVGQGMMRKIRLSLFTHMESLPIRYFDTHAHGDIMSVYTNDTDTLRQFIAQSIPQLVNSLITIIATFFSMVFLNIPLTVITVLMIVVMLLISKGLVTKSGHFFMKQQEDIGSLNGYIEEMMSGQKVVKIFNHEEKSIEQFAAVNERLRDSSDQANTFANIMMPVIMQLGNVSFVICAVAGGLFAINGYSGLTIGTIISFLTLNKTFNGPFGQIGQQLNAVVMAQAGISRIFEIIDEEPETDDGYVTLVNAKWGRDGKLTESAERSGIWAWKHYHRADQSTTYTEVKGDIVLDDVDFGYTDDKMVLHNISLYADEGQKLAFVGSTGAGKTTITNLINRFYDIQDGKIRYDGININKIKKADLRRSLGVVLQDTHLFTDTVMENIRYGRLDASDSECIAAAKLANADGFISRLPDGYHTVLSGDGANLSQGQRQLLSIARAAVADPPVLILDEATSSIDTHTEELVQRGMDGLMMGRTTFVIAHRLSTVKNSDCIMVLEQGRIIERGSHEKLIEEKGRYYQLYTGHLA